MNVDNSSPFTKISDVKVDFEIAEIAGENLANYNNLMLAKYWSQDWSQGDPSQYELVVKTSVEDADDAIVTVSDIRQGPFLALAESLSELGIYDFQSSNDISVNIEIKKKSE